MQNCQNAGKTSSNSILEDCLPGYLETGGLVIMSKDNICCDMFASSINYYISDRNKVRPCSHCDKKQSLVFAKKLKIF